MTPERLQQAFEEHDLEQRERWAQLSPLQRLQWLQQAKDFAAKHLGAVQRTRTAKSP